MPIMLGGAAVLLIIAGGLGIWAMNRDSGSEAPGNSSTAHERASAESTTPQPGPRPADKPVYEPPPAFATPKYKPAPKDDEFDLAALLEPIDARQRDRRYMSREFREARSALIKRATRYGEPEVLEALERVFVDHAGWIVQHEKFGRRLNIETLTGTVLRTRGLDRARALIEEIAAGPGANDLSLFHVYLTAARIIDTQRNRADTFDADVVRYAKRLLQKNDTGPVAAALCADAEPLRGLREEIESSVRNLEPWAIDPSASPVANLYCQGVALASFDRAAAVDAFAGLAERLLAASPGKPDKSYELQLELVTRLLRATTDVRSIEVPAAQLETLARLQYHLQFVVATRNTRAWMNARENLEAVHLWAKVRPLVEARKKSKASEQTDLVGKWLAGQTTFTAVLGKRPSMQRSVHGEVLEFDPAANRVVIRLRYPPKQQDDRFVGKTVTVGQLAKLVLEVEGSEGTPNAAEVWITPDPREPEKIHCRIMRWGAVTGMGFIKPA